MVGARASLSWMAGSILILLLISPPLGGATAGRLHIEGSTTVLPIAARAAELFQVLHPEIDVTIKGGGSSVGIAALINGTADIADASRPMKEKERDLATRAGVNPVEQVIARDGLALVIHPNNPVERLTFEQIAEIYTNPQAKNWEDFGGPDLPIVAVSRDSTSGTYGAFLELVIEEVKGEEVRLRPDLIYVSSNAELAATVAGAEGALGYLGIGYIKPGLKALPISKDGKTYVEASIPAVQAGRYPISRSLYMYTDGVPAPGDPRGLFLDFIYSRAGQCVVKEQGYVPLYAMEQGVCEDLFEALGAEFIRG